jgi:hypothetical protein
MAMMVFLFSAMACSAVLYGFDWDIKEYLIWIASAVVSALVSTFLFIPCFNHAGAPSAWEKFKEEQSSDSSRERGISLFTDTDIAQQMDAEVDVKCCQCCAERYCCCFGKRFPESCAMFGYVASVIWVLGCMAVVIIFTLKWPAHKNGTDILSIPSDLVNARDFHWLAASVIAWFIDALVLRPLCIFIMTMILWCIGGEGCCSSPKAVQTPRTDVPEFLDLHSAPMTSEDPTTSSLSMAPLVPMMVPDVQPESQTLTLSLGGNNAVELTAVDINTAPPTLADAPPSLSH